MNQQKLSDITEKLKALGSAATEQLSLYLELAQASDDLRESIIKSNCSIGQEKFQKMEESYTKIFSLIDGLTKKNEIMQNEKREVQAMNKSMILDLLDLEESATAIAQEKLVSAQIRSYSTRYHISKAKREMHSSENSDDED